MYHELDQEAWNHVANNLRTFRDFIDARARGASPVTLAAVQARWSTAINDYDQHMQALTARVHHARAARPSTTPPPMPGAQQPPADTPEGEGAAGTAGAQL